MAGGTPAAHPAWTEVKWPFPIDQWGTGRAFACKAADCGAEVSLYLRAKLGSCNCTTGIAEDADLDRMSDFDLVGYNPRTQTSRSRQPRRLSDQIFGPRDRRRAPS